MANSQKTNIKKIAAETGVSIATVSRYFNSPDKVAEKTREKIKSAILQLNYQQPMIKQLSVLHNGPRVIAAVFPHLQFGFYTEFLRQLIEQGSRKGYCIVPYSSTISKREELAFLDQVYLLKPAGIIMLSTRQSAEELEKLPVSVISVERSGGNFMQINNDNFTGGKLAAELLLCSHCEVFVHINNDYSTSWPSFKRIAGFECLLPENHPYERIICPELTNPFLPEATRQMDHIVEALVKKYPQKKLGVFCSNDDIARLFQQQCVIRQLSFPTQVELIGYDNSPVSDQAVFPITSIDQNISQMVQVAIDAFSSNYIPCETVIPCRLVEKVTTSEQRKDV